MLFYFTKLMVTVILQPEIAIPDPLKLPLMFPFSIVHSKSKTITHGVGCILEYQNSGTQAAVCKALQQAIQQHCHSSDNLQQAIMDIILENRMSTKFQLANQ
ncbi:hypothetical protein V8B97DRAFT_1017503 [Scleroderma yunnanense]